MVLLYYRMISINGGVNETYQEFLFDKFEPESAISFQCKCTVSELNRLFRSALVVLREDGLNSQHDWEVIVSETSQVLWLILL